MVLHEPDVRNHHVKDIFTHGLDVTAQFQLLAIQQHHANLPLHVLSLTAFLVEKRPPQKSESTDYKWDIKPLQ